jgi:ATP-binding cassette subfamily B protein
MFAGASAAVLAMFLAGLVILWMVWRTSSGLLTLGELALFYQAFSQGQKMGLSGFPKDSWLTQ